MKRLVSRYLAGSMSTAEMYGAYDLHGNVPSKQLQQISQTKSNLNLIGPPADTLNGERGWCFLSLLFPLDGNSF